MADRFATLGVQLNGADPDPNPHRLIPDYAWYQADPGAHDLAAPFAGPPPPAPGLIIGGPSDGPNILEWRQAGAPFGSVQTQFHITSGSLPPGIRLVQKEVRDASGGFNPWPVGIQNEFGWAGVPTEVGVFVCTVGASGAFGGDTYTWTIGLAGGCPTIEISPESPLPDAYEGVSYNVGAGVTFAADAGAAPFTWDVAPTLGDLPAGMALSSGGVLSGAPDAGALGAYSFAIRVTDDNGCVGILVYALEVFELEPITVLPAPPMPNGARGVLYVGPMGFLFTATGGTGAYVFTISAGELPPGFALSTGGVLIGFPLEAGAYTFTVRATDPDDNFGEQEYTIAISGLRILIGSPLVDVTPEVSAADLELTLNRQATGHLEIGDDYIPARGVDVLIYARDGVTPIFDGVVLTRRIGGMTDSNPANRGTVELVDYSIYFDDAQFSLAYTAPQYLEDVIADIVDLALAIYGITYTPTSLGITIEPFDWKEITVTDAFKRISDATGVVFRERPIKRLDVFIPLDSAAPATITDANINAFDLEWSDGPNLPANTVDLLCGPDGQGIATKRWTVYDDTEWEVDIQAVLGNAEPARRANAYLSPVDADNFVDGDTIGAGASTYTFRTALVGDVAGEVLIGATVEDSLGNLNAAINLAGGGNYAPSTPANADVSSDLPFADRLEVRALTVGAAGNAITVTSSNEAIAFWYGEGGIPRGTLQLGADATGVAGWTQGYILENPGDPAELARTISNAPAVDGYYVWTVTDGKGKISMGSGAVPPNGTVLELKYLAVFPFHARVPAVVGPPPRVFREAHPEIVEYDKGIDLATAILVRESSGDRELEVFTDVDGFLPGQELEVDTTHRGGIDAFFLVATVRIHMVNAELWEYRITGQQSEEYRGTFVEQWKALTSGSGSGAAAAPGELVAGGAIGAGDIYRDGRNPFTADQSIGGFKLRDGDDPELPQDLATKAYVDTATENVGYFEPLTNGDPAAPELVFDGFGDVIMVEIL